MLQVNTAVLLVLFFFTQIIWASIYGKFFFSEKLDFIAMIGIAIIIISGTVAIYNRNK